MNNTFLHQKKEPTTKFGQYLNGLFFGNDPARLLLNIFLKVQITKFLHNVVIVFAFHNIVEPDHVITFDFLHDPDL